MYGRNMLQLHQQLSYRSHQPHIRHCEMHLAWKIYRFPKPILINAQVFHYFCEEKVSSIILVNLCHFEYSVFQVTYVMGCSIFRCSNGSYSASLISFSVFSVAPKENLSIFSQLISFDSLSRFKTIKMAFKLISIAPVMREKNLEKHTSCHHH